VKTTTNVLAVDLGASSGRVILGRFDGNSIELSELHRFPNNPITSRGSVYWDVLLLWEEMKRGFRAYTQKVGGVPDGIGIDTWGVDYCLLDKAGALISNPYHYRDSRTEGMIDRVLESVSRERIYSVTGIQFMQLNTLDQLTSMVVNEDPQLEQADRLLFIPDLFNYWLTGRPVSEYTVASTSQLLDAKTRQWSKELVSELGIPTRILPKLIQPGQLIGRVLTDVASEVGFEGEVPVFAVASHDTGSAVAAVPDLDRDSAYLSSGTWTLMGAEIPEAILTDHALERNFTNEGGVGGTIRLLKNVAGLWLLQESRRQWQREGHDYTWEELEIEAERAEPFRSLIDPDHSDFIPMGDLPGAIRTFCRRTNQPEPTTVGAIVRCCLESLALRYRWVLSALEELVGTPLTTLRIVGGGSQNRLLNRFTANACTRTVIAGPVEAAALGNIVLQLIAAGQLPDLASGRTVIANSFELERFEPTNTEVWTEAYERFLVIIS